jgi:hypothetical protein
MMSRTAAAAALLNEQFWLDFGCERSAGLAFFNSPFMKKQPSTSTAALRAILLACSSARFRATNQ